MKVSTIRNGCLTTPRNGVVDSGLGTVRWLPCYWQALKRVLVSTCQPSASISVVASSYSASSALQPRARFASTRVPQALSTRGGLTLLDLPSFQCYGKMVSPATTSTEEFAGRSSGCNMMAAATTVTAYATAAASQQDPISGLAASSTLTNGNVKNNSAFSQFALTEQRYAIRGADVVAQGNVLTPISTIECAG